MVYAADDNPEGYGSLYGINNTGAIFNINAISSILSNSIVKDSMLFQSGVAVNGTNYTVNALVFNDGKSIKWWDSQQADRQLNASTNAYGRAPKYYYVVFG